MRALNAIDHVFLLLENRKQPMHVAGLCIFEIPKSAEKNFSHQLVEQIKCNKSTPSFPFNQVLKKLGFWDTDDNFDIQHHFRHIALPYPCGMAELMAYISREHGRMLDRTKPLWEFHLIDGLAPEQEGGLPRLALYLKMHHAMADGIGAMRLFQMSLSQSPNEKSLLPFWSLSTKHRNQIDALLPIHKPLWQIAKEQLGTITPIAKEFIKRFTKGTDEHFTSTFDAPKSILNQRISSARHLSVRSFDKTRFTTIANHFNITTNDAILAVCAGALREYLITQDALPDKPLIAFMPISLRRDGSAVGNQISFLLTNLGTHQHDPIERLTTIKNSINYGKRFFSGMSQAQIINYSALTYSWAGINLATRAYPTKQAFNLIISNVPGDSTPLYLNGARLTAMFPASVLLDGQALNITLTNYQDKLDFGITACSSALPDIDQLPSLLEKHLSQYEQLSLV